MSKEVHKAIVSRNDDPENLGRIRVICQSLTGRDQEMPIWIPPILPFTSAGSVGWFAIPIPGSEVDIELTISGNVDETYGESSISNPDMRYCAGEYSSANPIDADFMTNYPLRRGFAFKAGVFFFDDTEGSEQITLKFRPPGQVDPITITISDKLLLIDAPNASFNMKMKDGKILDGANQKFVRGNDLLSWLANFITTGYNLHFHTGVTTGPGVSGPPSVPLAAPIAADFLSTVLEGK